MQNPSKRLLYNKSIASIIIKAISGIFACRKSKWLHRFNGAIIDDLLPLPIVTDKIAVNPLNGSISEFDNFFQNSFYIASRSIVGIN